MKRSRIRQQMEFASKLVVNRQHGPVDIADKTVADDDARDLPIAATAWVRQSVQAGNDRGCASGLLTQRLVGELGQFHCGFPNARHRILQLGRPPNQSAKRDVTS
jgi:hypothetical protein